MIDQAAELRKLVLRAMREQPITTGPPPRLIALAGGKCGVGVTTIAVNLSVALAEQGSRVVVVDVDMHRSDVATLCGLNDYEYRHDFVKARRDIHEVLHPGPAGIQIVPGLCQPGLWRPELRQAGPPEHGVDDMLDERLQRQLLTLGRHADVVVLDLGDGSGELVRRFSATADELLLVTTPADAAIMDMYTRIKTDLASIAERSLQLVVNLTTEEAQAADVYRRIDSSCRKFLDLTVEFAGHVPQDDAISRGATDRIPFVLGEPMAPASRALGRLASVLAPTSSQVRIA